ncbi:hypothetical protein YV76_003174 [Salmonella enterica subsp. enterica]|nr:hypothetical protein [Salmonella enterica subsp. enterica]
MPVRLNLIPTPARQLPAPVRGRWLKGLAGLLIAGTLWSYFSALPLHSVQFWLFSAGFPLLLWLAAAWLRAMVFLPAQIQVNAWNKRREELLLKETRRGRRALQILQGLFITAHSEPGSIISPSTTALVRHDIALRAQSAWLGARSIRHSRLAVLPGITSDEFLRQIFAGLLPVLAVSFSRYPDNQPVALLLETDSSLSRQRISDLWHAAWQQSDIRQPVEFIDGYGLKVIDHWLDNRIRENTLLLVVALQVAPENPEGSGEAVAALLLGNRLTQSTLTPYALLHRPEQSAPDSLAENIAQALDWGPVQPDALHHLWRAGLSQDEQTAVMTLNGQSPLRGLEMNTSMYDLDNTLGQTGCTAPWLAIAAASQAARDMQADQLVISGEQENGVMWSTVVSPYQPVKESN